MDSCRSISRVLAYKFHHFLRTLVDMAHIETFLRSRSTEHLFKTCFKGDKKWAYFRTNPGNMDFGHNILDAPVDSSYHRQRFLVDISHILHYLPEDQSTEHLNSLIIC